MGKNRPDFGGIGRRTGHRHSKTFGVFVEGVCTLAVHSALLYVPDLSVGLDQ